MRITSAIRAADASLALVSKWAEVPAVVVKLLCPSHSWISRMEMPFFNNNEDLLIKVNT